MPLILYILLDTDKSFILEKYDLTKIERSHLKKHGKKPPVFLVFISMNMHTCCLGHIDTGTEQETAVVAISFLSGKGTGWVQSWDWMGTVLGNHRWEAEALRRNSLLWR